MSKFKYVALWENPVSQEKTKRERVYLLTNNFSNKQTLTEEKKKILGRRVYRLFINY